MAGPRPPQRVENDGCVDHRARHRPEDDPVAAVAVVRRPRHATALRLEPEQAGARRRDADRARAVRGERGGYHAGRHRCRGAAAGPARRALDVPWIAGHPPGHRLRERPQAQLRHPRLADHHRAARSEAPHDFGIVDGAGRERARSPAGHLPGEIDLVLDRHGHPQQRRVLARRPAPVGPVGVLAGAVGVHGAERVQVRIEDVDTRKRQLDQPTRGHLTPPQQLRLTRNTSKCNIGLQHRAHPNQTPPRRALRAPLRRGRSGPELLGLWQQASRQVANDATPRVLSKARAATTTAVARHEARARLAAAHQPGKQPTTPRSVLHSLPGWTNTSSGRHATRGEVPAAPLISGRLHRPRAHARSGRAGATEPGYPFLAER